MEVLGKPLFGFSPFGSAVVSGKLLVFLPPSGLSVVSGELPIVLLPSGLSVVSGRLPVVLLPSGWAVVVSEKTIGYVPAIWFGGCCWKKLSVALMSSTIGGVVLLDISVSWGACIGVLCVDTAAEEVCPPSTDGCGPIVGATVIFEPPTCDVSPVITVGIGLVVCSSDIIGLIGLVDAPPVPLVSSDSNFH
ncbi:unnamed protein product [Lactuca virosa]|uniref:Uncharacterized protein n=1 Tax=Lactuca virosa TaxID=75947 RepID=A0AAU9LFD0_9ASTR|nr:unnamed protein product [Lactuca virosa]